MKCVVCVLPTRLRLSAKPIWMKLGTDVVRGLEQLNIPKLLLNFFQKVMIYGISASMIIYGISFRCA